MRSLRISVLVGVAMLCAACSPKMPFRAYEPGALSADAGEAMYKSFYRAHKAGYVTKQGMDAYERAYEETKRAQHAYVDAVARGEETADEKRGLAKWVEMLLKLAYQYGIY